MILNTETILKICHDNTCNYLCPLKETGLCDEAAPFEINWAVIYNACRIYEINKTYEWLKVDEDMVNILEDKHYYLASIDDIKTPVKVKFILDAEIGFECDINHKKTFIRLHENKVKYIAKLPELPKEDI